MGRNVEELIARLRSGVPDKQVSAVLEVQDVISDLLEAAADALVVSTDPYFVAERLLGVGPALVPFLTPKFATTTDADTKDLIAIVLFALGWADARPWLLQVVGSGRTYEPGTIAQLARARDPQAAELINARFKSCDFSDVDLISEMLNAMEVLDQPVPEDVIERVRSSTLPWEVRSLVDPQLPPPWSKDTIK